MTTERAIIDYLHQCSHGVINLSRNQAKHIINLVQGTQPQQGAFVKLLRFNGLNNTYELQRTIYTTDAAINDAIQLALNTPPTEGFYQYDMYNSSNQFEGKLYTINPDIF